MSREYHLFIKDIMQCCEKVIRYTASMDSKAFHSNEVIYDAVIRNLEIIGETAKNIPEHIRSSYPKIEWRKVAGLRDIIKVKIPELLKSLESP